MLVVISIIGILAAIALPAFQSFRPNPGAVATAQLMADVGRARQLAISQHTTVYMVFMPMLSADQQFVQAFNTAQAAQQAAVMQLLDKQLTSYAYVSLRSIGDQPGRPTARYLSSWKTISDGAFIPWAKFPQPCYQPPCFQYGASADTSHPSPIKIFTNNPTGLAFSIPVFLQTTKIPFPTIENPISVAKNQYLSLPYIAFDYLGRLVDDNGNLQQPWTDNSGYHLPGLIPLSKGAVLYPRDTSKAAILGNPAIVPALNESPPGNTTNSYNLVNVDWLTGRGHAEHPELQ